jgi:NADH dehydrogenase FAD-containing subunit
MGNKTSANLSRKKHVIIVGGSYAGLDVTIKLWDHLKVTIVDANEYYEHTLYAYKALVEPNISEFTIMKR